MLIEVFYVPGCPNHQAAIDNIRGALRSSSISVPIQEIAVTDETTANQVKFPGSPKVRIDGQDVERNLQHSYGLACRLYSDGTGIPSLETLRKAVVRAQQRKN
jgi:hypothetical protein